MAVVSVFAMTQNNATTNKNNEVVVDSDTWDNSDKYDTGPIEKDQTTGNYTFAAGGVSHDRFESQEGGTDYTEDTYWVIAPGGKITDEFASNSDGGFHDYGPGGPFGFPLEAGALKLQNPDIGPFFPLTAAESGDVSLMKHIGGPGVIGQQVVVAASASVQEEQLATEDFYGNSIASFVNGPTFAGSQVTDGDVGQQGDDGWAYNVNAVGGSVDVTPKANVPMGNLGWPNVGTFTPSIMANNIDLSTTTPTFCVGQQVTFKPVWNSDPSGYSDPPNVVDRVAHWSLPGKFVNEQPYSYCPAYYDENAALLNRILSRDGTLSTCCWFVSGSGGGCSVGMNLYFSNGQVVFINASGNLIIYRPQVTPSFNSPGQIALYPGTSQSNPLEWPYTIMGLQSPSGTPIGLAANVSSQFPGTAQFVQVFSGNATGTWHTFNTAGSDWLDTSDPYPYPAGKTSVHTANNGLATPELVDQPWDACWNSPSTDNTTFTDYLQFTPDAGPGPNIFVTLATFTWNYYGKANEVDGVWSLDSSSSVTGPTGPVSSDIFPYWTLTW